MRHALRGSEEASLRVYVFESDEEPAIMVTVRPPADLSSPQRLRSVGYQRPQPHLKHLATGQAFYTRLARRDGFDDALLTGPDGIVSETASANICFLDESGLVWPDAPQLQGITMQLLEPQLHRGGPSGRALIRLRDIPHFLAAFVTNARGVAAVQQIDRLQLPVHAKQLQILSDAYASVPLDTI